MTRQGHSITHSHSIPCAFLLQHFGTHLLYVHGEGGLLVVEYVSFPLGGKLDESKDHIHFKIPVSPAAGRALHLAQSKGSGYLNTF